MHQEESVDALQHTVMEVKRLQEAKLAVKKRPKPERSAEERRPKKRARRQKRKGPLKIVDDEAEEERSDGQGRPSDVEEEDAENDQEETAEDKRFVKEADESDSDGESVDEEETRAAEKRRDTIRSKHTTTPDPEQMDDGDSDESAVDEVDVSFERAARLESSRRKGRPERPAKRTLQGDLSQLSPYSRKRAESSGSGTCPSLSEDEQDDDNELEKHDKINDSDERDRKGIDCDPATSRQERGVPNRSLSPAAKQKEPQKAEPEDEDDAIARLAMSMLDAEEAAAAAASMSPAPSAVVATPASSALLWEFPSASPSGCGAALRNVRSVSAAGPVVSIPPSAPERAQKLGPLVANKGIDLNDSQDPDDEGGSLPIPSQQQRGSLTSPSPRNRHRGGARRAWRDPNLIVGSFDAESCMFATLCRRRLVASWTERLARAARFSGAPNKQGSKHVARPARFYFDSKAGLVIERADASATFFVQIQLDASLAFCQPLYCPAPFVKKFDLAKFADMLPPRGSKFDDLVLRCDRSGLHCYRRDCTTGPDEDGSEATSHAQDLAFYAVDAEELNSQRRKVPRVWPTPKGPHGQVVFPPLAIRELVTKAKKGQHNDPLVLTIQSALGNKLACTCKCGSSKTTYRQNVTLVQAPTTGISTALDRKIFGESAELFDEAMSVTASFSPNAFLRLIQQAPFGQIVVCVPAVNRDAILGNVVGV